MGDADLARKFHGLVDPVLGIETAKELLGSLRSLPDAPDLRPLIAKATTGAQRGAHPRRVLGS